MGPRRNERGRSFTAISIAWLCLIAAPPSAADGGAPRGVIRVPVAANLAALLEEEDTDGDKLITVADRGDRRFELHGEDGAACLVEGTYHLGNVLQEFGVARRSGREVAVIRVPDLYADPARRTSRMIRRYYWDWLTRSLGPHDLERMLQDEKAAPNSAHRIYVPHGDREALDYYQRLASEQPEIDLRVVRLPETITTEYVKETDNRPGILSLALIRSQDGQIEPVPYVVPGGRFNEMYGWDSYFIVLGLLANDRIRLAQGMVDNLVYEIEQYGKILNANRTYYLTRSQPPFLTSMARAVYARLPRTSETHEWLGRVLRAAIREYETVWTSGEHMTRTGLSRYYDYGSGMPPEADVSSYADVLRPYAEADGLDIATFGRRYRAGLLSVPRLDEYFRDDRAMRESGHDTTYRLVARATRLNSVALNSLLYRYETDIAEIIRREFGDEFAVPSGRWFRGRQWKVRADRRRRRMIELMWNHEQGLFFDYDFVEGKQWEYVSATTFYPLWAGVVDRDRARRLSRAALAELEAPGGILSSTEASRGPVSKDRPLRQWDYPFAWAPHQMLVWQGLKRYGMHDEAERLAYRWLYMVALNSARYNGAIAEKYDAVRRTFGAEVEYGNVGVRFQYVPDGGFGWTNASFQVGRRLLGPVRRRALARMIPPEMLFDGSRKTAAR